MSGTLLLLLSWFAWLLIAGAWVVVAVTIALPLGDSVRRRDRQVPTDQHEDDQLVGPD